MSMHEESENFEQLRRLLALKRHEMPPPGYFNHFSGQVIARIKAGEVGERSSFFDRLLWEAPWLQRFWMALDAKPVLAGVCGMAACSLLVAGVLLSETGDATPAGLVPVATVNVGATPVPLTTIATAEHPLSARPVGLVEAPSTSPIPTLPGQAPFLGDLGQLRADRAVFTLPSGN